MTDRIKKFLAIGLVLVMSATMLAGCGGESDSSGESDGSGSDGVGGSESSADTGGSGSSGKGDVTIKFVHKFPEENRAKFFEEVVADFEEANPGIKIEMTSYGDEEIKDKTRVLLGSADAPDVYFTWSGERITQYVDSGNTLDISSYLEEDSDWKDSFNQTMLETCNKNGSYWAIPWDYSSKEMIYNKAVFADAGIESVPATWDEFLDVCQKLKDKGYTPIAVGNQYSWVVCHYLTTLNGKLVPKETLDANYTMQEGYVEYTDPGYAEALDLMKELYDKGYINDDVNSCTWEMSQSMVKQGTAGMIYEEVQDFVYYEEALGDDWAYFDFPEIEGEKGEAGYITGGPDVFMVNSESEHPDEAVEFLKYLTSDEVQAKMVYDLGFLPTTSVELDETQCMPETIEVIEKNLNAPGISEWLDCAINQTVADEWLDGCQTIFLDETGESVMSKVSEVAKEEAEE